MTLTLTEVDYSNAAKQRRATTLALGLLMLEEKRPAPGMLERAARMPSSELSTFLDRARNGDLPRIPFYNGERAICLREEAPPAWDRPDRANKTKSKEIENRSRLAQSELFSPPWQRELLGMMLRVDGVLTQEALRHIMAAGIAQPDNALKRLRATLQSLGIHCESRRLQGHTWQYCLLGADAERMIAIMDRGWMRTKAARS